MNALTLLLWVSGAFARPATGDAGMAATGHPLATDAAIEILAAGGNAVDAAVAATFVISVTNPFDAGIGGGGFAMVHVEKSGEVQALDFREVAPAAATRNMYLRDGKPDGDLSLNGPTSVAVPGTVPGLFALHQRFGRLPWRKLLRPAIAAARDGFVVGERFVGTVAYRLDVLKRYPSTRAVFFHPDGTALGVGEVLRQPELARTLEAIANDATTATKGSVAQKMAEAVSKAGGALAAQDLANYTPRWRKPLCRSHDGHELCTMPPPSSGGVHLLQILALMNGMKRPDASKADAAKPTAYHDPNTLHAMIEAMRLAYADRATYLGDPDFADVPVEELLSPAYLQKRSVLLQPTRARLSSATTAGTASDLGITNNSTAKPSPRKESNDTSHLSVVDADHNAVSLTFTVNYGFGSGFVAAGTGIVMNDEMDDFSIAPGTPNSYGLLGGEANAIAARKVPLSSMTPLLVRDNSHFAMSFGAPGGSTIITTVLQTYLNVSTLQMDCQAAVAAPRIHHQWQPDVTRYEAFGLDALTLSELQGRGHRLELSTPWGNAMCIRVTTRAGHTTLEGGADPRGEGTARGYSNNGAAAAPAAKRR